MTLTQRTATNILWKGSSVTLNTILNFVLLAILANLLAPSDFGLRGIILIMMGFLLLLSDLGLGAALVHEPTLTPEQFSTAFYLNVLLGLALAAVLFASSGLVAAFFREERLTLILRVMSLAFLLSSSGAIFAAQLQKELRFKTLFIINFAEWAVSGVASVWLALRGLGVWCIVFGYMLGILVRIVLLWGTASRRPGLMFKRKSVDRFLKFGLFVYGQQILNFLTRNLDNIIIGRYLGPEALGYYSLAYSLMLTPVSRISDSVSQVIFPAFSLIQHDDERIRAGYLKVVRFVAFVTFPMMAGMLVVAPQLIVAIYGPKWMPAVGVLQIFCLIGALQSVVSLAQTVQYTKGRSDIGFKLNLLALGCDATAFFIGVRYGILGVAVAYAFLALILEPTIQIVTNRLIGLSSRSFLRQFRLPTFGAFLIIVLVLAFKGAVGTAFHPSPAWLLIGSVGLGLAAYGLLALGLGGDMIREALRMIGYKRDPADPGGSGSGRPAGIEGQRD
jgi:O-antigen/teichoic acid export membrane protein